MGHRTIEGLDGEIITIDENGMFVNTKNWDSKYYVTTDPIDISAAASHAKHMIAVLERGTKAGGFTEQDCLSLVDSFLTIGQWTIGSGYARPVSVHFTFRRTPRNPEAGQKYSTTLLRWLKRFAISFDPKDRREAFYEIQAQMLDFVWSFHTGLIKKHPERVKQFERDLHATATEDRRLSYRKRFM